MFASPGTHTVLPATAVVSLPTRDTRAWLGDHHTIRLYEDLSAVRVHVNAGEGASIHPHLAGGAGEKGRWFAIGDYIQTYDEYVATHALPAHFTHITMCRLLAGTVLNVGRCGPLFGRPGGAEQAEFISGPDPEYQAVDATWSREAGHA